MSKPNTLYASVRLGTWIVGPETTTKDGFDFRLEKSNGDTKIKAFSGRLGLADSSSCSVHHQSHDQEGST